MAKVAPIQMEFTPEEYAQVMAEMKAKFTADDLYGYIEGDEEHIPIEEVIASGKELIRQKRAVRNGNKI